MISITQMLEKEKKYKNDSLYTSAAIKKINVNIPSNRETTGIQRRLCKESKTLAGN